MKPAVFKFLRTSHRWLGLFFAPLIVLFALSGLLQTLHADEWAGPEWAMSVYYAMEDAHQEQRLRDGTSLEKAATVVVAAMAVGLVLSSVAGVVMAYVMYPKRRVRTTVVLVLGVAVPAVVMLV